MKFTSKIARLTCLGAVGSICTSSLVLPAIAPRSIRAAATQLAQALAPEEVNLRAKQIIVRIDGANVGSGSIIERTDGSYTVLTNWHVMQNAGDYTIQTIDGRKHKAIPASIQQLPGLDLAVVKFESNQNYQTAEFGDSGNLSEGQTVYFAGYPGELRREDNRYYRFFTANLVGILPKSTENGYSLVYNGEAFPGMSGSPVFNQEGLVIGVHGEANVAFTGGTSNYAIPIANYQQAVVKLNTQPSQPEPQNSLAETSPPGSQESGVAENPEVIVPESEASPQVQPEAEQSSEQIDSDNISSVPTFADETKPESQPEASQAEASQTESLANKPETVIEDATEASSEESTSQPQAEPKPEVEKKPKPVEEEEVYVPTVSRKIALVSPKTGIDYTTLRNLLKDEKWSEADLHTYRLIEQIVKSAKLNKKRTFIELKTIAEYSCSDIRTVDSLWKKYSSNKFGFTPQQRVWRSVNQEGDFSTQTWRRFATEVGWKEGEVDSGNGYLLYDQLDFNPSQAPAGHLPWWFALSEEEQKVMKYLFARCNLNPTLAELETEAQKNPSDTAQNSGNNRNNRRNTDQSNTDKQNQQPSRN